MLQKIVDNKFILGTLMVMGYVGAVVGTVTGFYLTYLLVTWIGAGT